MKRREPFLDILRIISIFLVLYVHTGEELMYSWIGKNGLKLFLGMSMTQLSVCGTSIFFIISGYLLLDKEESVLYLLKHRVLRFGILLFAFGFIQQFYEAVIYNNLQNLDFMTMFKRIYSSYVIGQYWFLYSYFAFLLILPFLRAMVKNISTNQAVYLIAVYLIVEVFADLCERLLKLNRPAIVIPVLDTIIFLPVIGYFIKHTLENILKNKKSRIAIYVFGFLSWLFSVVYGIHTYKKHGETYGIDGLYIVVAVCLFIFVREIFSKRDFPDGTVKLLEIIGHATLLIYLAEIQFKAATHFVYSTLQPYLGCGLSGTIWLVVCMLFGTIVTFLLRLLPGIKKLI